MCADPDEMKLKFMAGKTRYLKKTKEGVSHMSQIMEEYAKEYAKECIDEYNVQMAVKLLEMGELTCTKISNCTKLSIEELVALAKTNGIAYQI